MTFHPPAVVRAAELAAKFGRVTAWIFDLDNTLYPPDSGLWPAIEERITHFLIEHSGLDGRLRTRFAALLLPSARDDAARPRRGGRRSAARISRVRPRHRPFVAEAQSGARAEIARLPGRKLIFTNGSRRHAMATVEQLGLAGLFEDAFDIVAAGLVPKPRTRPTTRSSPLTASIPSHAAMFEDIAKNLVVPKARGMTTVLVAAKPGQTDHRQDFDRAAAAAGTIDFVTDDLAGFLRMVNDTLGSQAGDPE